MIYWGQENIGNLIIKKNIQKLLRLLLFMNIN